MRLTLLLLVIGIIGLSAGFSSEIDDNNQNVASVDSMNIREIREAEARRKPSVRKEKKKKKARRSRGRKKESARRRAGSRNCGGQSRQTESDTFCPKDVAVAMELRYNKVVNFEKQMIRASNFNKLAKKKSEKKGNFEASASMVQTAVGGDLSNPTCATARQAAASAATVGSTLADCSSKIETSCPEPAINDTLTGACTTKVEAFKTKETECEASKTDCTCWKAASAMKSDIMACDSKTEQTSKKGSWDTCKNIFKACKTAQDDSIENIAACSTVTTKAPGRRIQYLAEMMARNAFRKFGTA